MNTKRKKVFYLFLSILFVNLSLPAQQILVTNSSCTGTDCTVPTNIVSFQLSGIQFTNPKPEDSYRIFWHFGDGSYADILTDDLSETITHAYPMGSFPVDDVYAEATRIYTENDPPMRIGFTMPSNTIKTLSIGNCPTCTDPPVIPPDDPLSITTNRNFVPEQEVTIIIPYDLSCKGRAENKELAFYYDATQLNILSKSFDSHITFSGIDGNTGRDAIRWDASFIENNYAPIGNLFIRVNLIPGVNPGDAIDIRAKLTNNGTCPDVEVVLDGIRVVNSHDPNDLDSPHYFFCPEDFQDSVDYVIRFQNNGNGPAKKVIIKDIIPEVYDINSIRNLYPLNTNGDVLQHTVNGREVSWELKDDFLSMPDSLLEGTSQNGYGVDFNFDDTKGKIVFRIAFNTLFIPEPCESIVNQAEIIFDCNPSYFTNPHFLNFGCEIDSICVFCDGNTLNSEPIVEDIDTTASLVSALFPSLAFSFDTNDPATTYRWYPPVDMDATNILDPAITPTKSRDFFLVAAQVSTAQCARVIRRFPLRITCPLNFTSKVSCNFMGGITIEAEASGYSNATSLVWQDCSTGATFSKVYNSRLNQDSFLLSLVDTSNGCSVSRKIPINCQGGIRPRDIGYAVLAGIFIVAVLLLIRRFNRG